MESDANAGDDNSSFAFKLPVGYFVSQTPRIELLGGAAMHKLPPPLSNQEAIGREIMKEKIRQEILAREMAERRILEEEVRRELEIERIMEMRRFHMERYSALAGSTDLVIHGRELVHDSAELAFRERSIPHMIAAQSSYLHKPEKSSLKNEITASKSNFSGAKRKAHGELLPQGEKHWGCAICEVSATSEKCLKLHLQGKRHKTKVLQSSKKSLLLPLSKKNFTSQSEVASFSGSGNKKQIPLKVASASEPGGSKMQSPLKGELSSGPVKKQQKLFCRLCRVKCNSKKMLEVHLSGKKHKIFMELKELKKVTNIDETVAMNEGSNEVPCGLNEDHRGPNCGTTEEHYGPKEEHCGPNEEHCGPNEEFSGPNEEFCGPNEEFSGPNEEFCGPNEEPCGSNEEPCGSNEEPCVPNEEPCGPNEEPRQPNEEPFGPNEELCGPNEEFCGSNGPNELLL